MAVNSLQATFYGFNVVNEENVIKVCDQPPPVVAKQIVQCCVSKDMVGARSGMTQLWNLGYSSSDIVGTIFKVTKVCQLRIAEGATTLLQLLGLVAKMCEK